MTNQPLRRRKALTQLVLCVLGSCWAFISCAPFRRREDSSNEIALLRADVAKLDRPPDWEKGVPVLLVGENLAAPERRAHRPGGDGPKLAADFRKIADAFLETHPTAARSDIPKLVEVLALRDFGTPGHK